MSEDRLQHDITRAARARALLDDDLLKEAFATVDAELVTFWRRQSDAAERERIWQATNLLDKVKSVLAGAISNGKVAQAELDALIEQQQNTKR